MTATALSLIGFGISSKCKYEYGTADCYRCCCCDGMLLVIIEIIDEQVMTSNIKEIKEKYLKKTSMNFQ